MRGIDFPHPTLVCDLLIASKLTNFIHKYTHPNFEALNKSIRQPSTLAPSKSRISQMKHLFRDHRLSSPYTGY